MTATTWRPSCTPWVSRAADADTELALSGHVRDAHRQRRSATCLSPFALVYCLPDWPLLRIPAGGGSGGGGGAFRGKRESGKEHPYSCVVLAGARSMEERRAALQVREGWVAGSGRRWL